MNEERGSQESESKARFDREQYERLKRCSDERNMTEWNKWRKQKPDEQILLEDAPLQNAWLWNANLQGARLNGANLQGAQLEATDLEGAYLNAANLQEAQVIEPNLQGAHLIESNLQGAQLVRANPRSSDFSRAIVDGKTLIWGCGVDHTTKFEGVGLGKIRIYPGARQLLEYNIRRMNWEQWHKYEDWESVEPQKPRTLRGKVLRWPVHGFWWVSDYGLSTGRIVLTFFGLAMLFALLYYVVGGLVADLHVTGHDVTDFVRACYFSIVTMTTLGFGDMYANEGSWAGHILLILQVLLGYVLLAALVTRFAVLFTGGGPASSKTEIPEVDETEDDENFDDELRFRFQSTINQNRARGPERR